jgi:hypothetical protein
MGGCMTSPSTPKEVLQVYKTNLGLFLKSDYYLQHNSASVKINGKFISEVVSSVNNGFIFLKGIHEITSLERLKTGNYELKGYVLKIAAVASDEIPLKLSVEDVGAYYNDDLEEWCCENYTSLKDLYKEDRVKAEDTWEQKEFNVEVLREFIIENYEEPAKTKVTNAAVIPKVPYGSSNVLADVVQYSDIEKLITPEILMHERPCSLSKGQVYAIIRQYVKENINPKVARITSVYDFCLTVKKVIKIKPYVHKREILKQNGRSYSTPKYTTSTVSEKMEEVFNLAPKAYQHYNVAEQWDADNLKDMAEQVRVYLEDLMENINKPLEECGCCGGTGVIIKEKE